MPKPEASRRPPSAGVVPGAGGVVFNARGEVLLLRHAGGSWVFAKGHIDPGESALEAAVREVEEESGVTAECPDPGFSHVTRYRNSRQEARVITWFPLLVKSERVGAREALFVEAGFFPAAEALRRLSYEEDRRLLAVMLDWWRRRTGGGAGG